MLFPTAPHARRISSKWKSRGGQKLGRADTGNWLRGTNNRLYHVPLYDSEEEVLHGVFLAVLDPVNMRIKETYRAEKGFYREGRWVFENCLHSVMGNGKIVRQERFPTREMDLDEEPEDFAGVQLSAHEMGYFQLRDLIRDLGLTGGILKRYQAEMSYKLALPVSCFVLTLVGMAWSLKPHFSGISVELLGSILIGAGYMAANAFCLSLGGKGVLSPWIAGWITTLLLAFIGFVLLIRRQYFAFA
ncbi:MAG TPA: LptF/LptG family permease [bacterium]|nr:LptF/LptG family permease [bacterium]